MLSTAHAGGGARARAERDESGVVTAELAVALPAAVLVLAIALAALGLMLDQIRCVDAARVAARAAARGDTTSLIAEAARQTAPEGSKIDVDAGPPVKVVVTAPARTPWLSKSLRARAAVTAPSETTAAAHRPFREDRPT